MMAKPTEKQKQNRAAIKRYGVSKMKRQRIGRLLSEGGEPVTITCKPPAGYFGFPIKEVDPVTRALIDAATAERSAR